MCCNYTLAHGNAACWVLLGVASGCQHMQSHATASNKSDFGSLDSIVQCGNTPECFPHCCTRAQHTVTCRHARSIKNHGHWCTQSCACPCFKTLPTIRCVQLRYFLVSQLDNGVQQAQDSGALCSPLSRQHWSPDHRALMLFCRAATFARAACPQLKKQLEHNQPVTATLYTTTTRVQP